MVLHDSPRAELDAVHVEPRRAPGAAAAAIALGFLGVLAPLAGGVVLLGSYASWTSAISPMWGYALLACGAVAICSAQTVGETTPSTADDRLHSLVRPIPDQATHSGVFLTTRTPVATRPHRQAEASATGRR
jgi:hypothetical protein